MPKNLLIAGHTRSGGHFLMNSISMNFPYYTHHRCGKDFHRKAEADKVVEKLLKKETNEIQIARQQYWTYEPFADILRKNWVVLYILRDGRDVMASLYDMHKKEYKWTNCKTLGSFIRAPLSKKSYERALNIKYAKNPIESWLMHWESWLEYFYAHNDGHPPNIVRYEDLYYHFDLTIRKIGGILGMAPQRTIDRPNKEFNSIRPRKGCPGQWQEVFTKEDRKYYNSFL